MLSRRNMLVCGLATLGVPWLPAVAHEPVSAPQIVGIKAELPPGEIHVDPDAFALYWTLSDLTARVFCSPPGDGGPVCRPEAPGLLSWARSRAHRAPLG